MFGEAVVPFVVNRAAGPEPGHLGVCGRPASEHMSVAEVRGGGPGSSELQQVQAGGEWREEGWQVDQLVGVDTQAAFGVFCVGGTGRVLGGHGRNWAEAPSKGCPGQAPWLELTLKGGARILRGWPWLRP